MFAGKIDARDGWQDLDNMAKELDFWMKDRDDQTVPAPRRLDHTPQYGLAYGRVGLETSCLSLSLSLSRTSTP